MDWKTDPELNMSEDQPYSTFNSNKPGRFLDRLELPVIFMGAGLLAIIILFVLFIPKKNEVTIDDYRHLVSRIDQLEDRLDALTSTDVDVRQFDPDKNPVGYQQLVNWIKSNAEVITETIKKVDAIEKRLPAGLSETQYTASSESRPLKSEKKKKPAKIKLMPQETRKPEPAVIDEPIETSKPVQVQSREIKRPETAEKPKEMPSPIIKSKPADQVKPPAPLPTAAKPETYKLIFHTVEKGETLYRISRKYGLTVEQLQELNDMKKDDLLITVGQELIVRREKQP